MNLSEEEKMMLDGINLGLDPFPTPRNFDVLWNIVKKAHLLVQRPVIVCLCGSTRFSQAFHEANLRETLAGRIVLSIGCDLKSDTDLLLSGELTAEDKARLDELHLRKIDLADEVLILNVEGYIGESTRREIKYALDHDKNVRWLESAFGQHSLAEIKEASK